MLAHWHTRSVLLALFVLAYSSAAAVSAEDTNDSSGPPTYRSTVSEVRVTFFATDENNHPLETLTKSDFAVVDNERVVRNFRSFTHSDETSLDVIVLVDLSESVAPRFRVAISDVLQLVAREQSIPDDNIAVLSFGGASGGTSGGTFGEPAARHPLLERLPCFRPSGQTPGAEERWHNAAVRRAGIRSRFHLTSSPRRGPAGHDSVLGRRRHHQHAFSTRGAAGGAGRWRTDLLR